MDLREFFYRPKDLRNKEIKANILVGYGLTYPSMPRFSQNCMRWLQGTIRT